MSMKDWIHPNRRHKVFSFGKFNVYGKRRVNEVELEIELRTDEKGRPVFAAEGGIWNASRTDYYVCGQCIDDILDLCPELHKNELYMTIFGLWKRNHLNDMNAGTPKQTAIVNEWLAKGNRYDFDKVCEILRKRRCYTDHGYQYGSGWIYREISADDMVTIEKLLAD